MTSEQTKPSKMGEAEPIVSPHAVTRVVEALTPRRALVVSSLCALVALVVEVKGLMVIPMTATFIADVGMSPVTAGWVLLSAQLVGISTLGLLSRLGDVYGHRKVLLWTLAAICIGNLITGLAQGTEMVIAGRVLGGLNATTSLVLAIQRDWMEPKELRRGIGFVAGIQCIGVSLSFLFAGVFIHFGMGWRAVFLVCSALALVNIVTVLIWVPESVTRAKVKIDYLGAALLAAWPTCLLLAVSKSSAWGWTGRNTILLVAAGAVLFWLFTVVERKHPEPLVELGIAFGPRLLPAFVAAGAMAFGAFMCYIGITNFVQIPRELAGYGFGYTVFQGGLVLLPMAIVMTVMSFASPWIVARFGARPPTVLGSALMGVTFLYWVGNHDQVWQFVLPAFVWALGLALVLVGGLTVATEEAPVGQTGITNGMLMLWIAIGTTFGTAVSTALRAKEFVPGTLISVESGWSNTFLAGAIVSGVGLLAALLIPRGVGRGQVQRPTAGH